MYKGKRDQYFSIRHTVDGKQIEEGYGWASKGRTAEKAYKIYLELDENKANGKGPRTLKEKRQLEADKKAKKTLEQMTFDEVWARYLIWAEANKDHWGNDEYRYRLHIAPAFGSNPASSVTPYALET